MARWRIVTHLLSLSDEQFVKDRFCLASTSLQSSWPIDGVEFTAPSLILAEIVKDFHQGQFDPCLRTFLAQMPRRQDTGNKDVCLISLLWKGFVFREGTVPKQTVCRSKSWIGRNWKQLRQEWNPAFPIPFPCYHHFWSGSAQQMLNLEKIQVRMDDFNKASVAHAAPVTCAEPAAVARRWPRWLVSRPWPPLLDAISTCLKIG